MDITLTPEQEQILSEQLESGLFHALVQVIDAALRLLKAQAVLYEHRLVDLRQKIAQADEQIARGGVYSFESAAEFTEHIKAEGRRRLAERRRALRTRKDGSQQPSAH